MTTPDFLCPCPCADCRNRGRHILHDLVRATAAMTAVEVDRDERRIRRAAAGR